MVKPGPLTAFKSSFSGKGVPKDPNCHHPGCQYETGSYKAGFNVTQVPYSCNPYRDRYCSCKLTRVRIVRSPRRPPPRRRSSCRSPTTPTSGPTSPVRETPIIIGQRNAHPHHRHCPSPSLCRLDPASVPPFPGGCTDHGAKCCDPSASPNTCPSKTALAQITQIGIWGEGTAGECLTSQSTPLRWTTIRLHGPNYLGFVGKPGDFALDIFGVRAVKMAELEAH